MAITDDSSDAYFQALSLGVENKGEQMLEKQKAEIEQQKVGSTAPVNKTIFIVIGIAGAALVTLAILKKKGVF